MEQERLIPTAESLTVEFKSDHKGPLGDKDLVLAAVCLANNQGGDLYLGVEDDGTVTGLHSTRDRNRDLAAVMASRTNPPAAGQRHSSGGIGKGADLVPGAPCSGHGLQQRWQGLGASS
ncbi:ATP-binding protein [Microcystis elabens FACHB-917]|nr:ATP-binding protein [Microcystis elabens FACHB-917]